MAGATDVPLNVDAEHCFADVVTTVERIAETGAAGISIEDWNPDAGAVDPIDVAVERVGLAADAARHHGLVLTARAENHLYGIDDLDDTVARLVAYGAAEAGRDYNVADISERTLHEVYLPPFKAAVDAGAQSIMASFNEIAGVPMHAHRPLIQDLLRKEWGWDGLLVSDYTGVMELMPHGVAANPEQAGALGLRAILDAP